MRKILVILLFLLTGCTNELANTPIKKVEQFFLKYQSLDNDVLKQLDNVVDNDLTLTKKQKEKYKEIMKNHYRTLKYDIKDEVIDGDNATVTVQIEVTDYSKKLKELNKEKNKFKTEEEFNDYRLNRLQNLDERVKYTIDLTLTKIDNIWTLDHISDDIKDKIEGIYAY